MANFYGSLQDNAYWTTPPPGNPTNLWQFTQHSAAIADDDHQLFSVFDLTGSDTSSLSSYYSSSSSNRKSAGNSPDSLFNSATAGGSGGVSPLESSPVEAVPPTPTLRKSSRNDNFCETVAVESSAHVAQIVGKNGCKIKHLRAKFDTYIHTPSSGQEPVFIIKGARDKVYEVKQEIIKAANHFTNIKNARAHKISAIINSQDSTCLRLSIPVKYVGLVVGRSGWFVKELQTKHNVYIETPKFEQSGFFQLFGGQQTVTLVKDLIYEHMVKKTGINFAQEQQGNDFYFTE